MPPSTPPKAQWALADQNPATNPEAAAAMALGEFTTHRFSDSDPGMKRDEQSFTWSLNLQYDLTDSIMGYAMAATGYKAGGFNSFYMGLARGQGADSREVDFEEEEVLTYEAGLKMGLLDGAAELNLAIFRTEFDDLQAAVFAGNTTFEVQNAAEATLQGVELDGRWQATDNLMLQAALGYLDFEYDEFPNQALRRRAVSRIPRERLSGSRCGGQFCRRRRCSTGHQQPVLCRSGDQRPGRKDQRTHPEMERFPGRQPYPVIRRL